jgi:hypothetical protein
LGLTAGHGACLLVIATDGQLDSRDQWDTTAALIGRLKRYRCAAMQLCLNGGGSRPSRRGPRGRRRRAERGPRHRPTAVARRAVS